MSFTRRQIVRHRRLVGLQFTPDWSEKVVIVGQHPDGAITQVPGDAWYVICFDDGGMLSAHASNLMASNEAPFKGRLPTYAATQR